MESSAAANRHLVIYLAIFLFLRRPKSVPAINGQDNAMPLLLRWLCFVMMLDVDSRQSTSYEFRRDLPNQSSFPNFDYFDPRGRGSTRGYVNSTNSKAMPMPRTQSQSSCENTRDESINKSTSCRLNGNHRVHRNSRPRTWIQHCIKRLQITWSPNHSTSLSWRQRLCSKQQ